MWLLEALFLVLVVVLSIPVFAFAFQVLISLPRWHKRVALQTRRPSLAVVIPAHNEENGISATLRSIQAQLQAGDRMLVVADNCADRTAVVARAAGAEAVERSDITRRGKGYALDFGIRYLGAAPTEVVIIVDADCLVHEGALDQLARKCIEADRPIQALYLMHTPAGASLKTKVAEFAWLVKNWLRPLGFLRLGLPCQLMGTGMAFPWAAIERAELASGHIVEDLKLGMDFARTGRSPLFFPEAVVSSVFPLNSEGVQSQRTRWEHGHLGMIVKEAPKLLLESLGSMNVHLFALVIDMCVPPLALLLLMELVLGFFGTITWGITGHFMPWGVSLLALVALGFSVLLAWVRCGREILSLGDLAYAPLYALSKIPLYLKFLVERQVEWVRSKRD